MFSTVDHKIFISIWVRFCLSLILPIGVAAQNAPYKEVSIASPTAAALAKYADIPVNQHTGIPNISIPIYSVKEGPLELPISLSYHASGLKVLEPASWVGLGWSLNAGGVISRTVVGAPDEKGTNSVFGQTHGHFTEKGFSNYLIIPGSLSDHPDQFKQDWKEIADGRKDGEPDLFFFNLAGISGKFYFRDDQTPVLIPEQDVQIKCAVPVSGSSITGFTLIVADGTKYHFGRTASTTDVDPVEETDPYTSEGGLSEGKVISSWYLNKIESADGLFSISLSYVAENYAYHTLSSFPIPGNNLSYDGKSIPFEYKLVKNMVKGVRLHTIRSSYQQVLFTGGASRQDLTDTYREIAPDRPNTSAMTLGSINITDQNNQCVKSYVFEQSYFEDAVTPLNGYFSFYQLQTDRKRLRLDALLEQSCSGSLTIPYRFEYYEGQVPRRICFAQDHWGFYNGKLANNTLIPTFVKDSFETVVGADRDASWPAMRSGVLKKILYPTGGTAEFVYEPNDTWVSYNTKKFTPISNGKFSAGFDGSAKPVTISIVINNSPVRFTITNAALGGVAKLTIINTATGTKDERSANPGEIKIGRIHLTSGTYTISLEKSFAQTGQGVTVDLEEWTTETIQRNEMVGGLRIASVVQTDHLTGTASTTKYLYRYADGRSTGVLYSRPTYVQKVRNDILKLVGSRAGPTPTIDGCGWEAPTSGFFYKTGGSLQPLATSQGYHLGYNEAKVVRQGNGYTIYRYFGSSFWDGQTGDVAVRSILTTVCNSNIPNFPAAPLPFEFMRGEPSYEGVFTESGKLVKEMEYAPVYEQNPIFTPALMVSYSPWEAPPSGGWQSGSGPAPNLATFYQLYTSRKKELKVTTRTYSTADNKTTTEITTRYFDSPYHFSLSRELTNTSLANEYIEVLHRYSSDYIPQNCASISNCWPAYTNAINTADQQYYIARSSCSTHACRWDEWQRYIRNRCNARKEYTTCRAGYQLAYNNCIQTLRDAADPLLKPIFELQLRNMVLPLEQTKWQANKLVQASFTQYDFSALPETMVYPRFIKFINLGAASASFTPSVISGNTLGIDGRYTNEIQFLYEHGNLAELTKRDGIPVTYVWGYQQNFPVAKITGASLQSLKAMASPLNTALLSNPSNDEELRTELGKLRVAFPLSEVQTYTYQPTIGVSSETDNNGRTTYYEYDALQRLALVRDYARNIVKRLQYRYANQNGE